MADSAAVNGKWDGTGCAGMARCPLPAKWPWSPIPHLLLQRLQLQFIYIPCPWLKAGRTYIGTSQWDLWQGYGPGRKILHTYSCARRSPHLCRLRCEEAKGKSGQVQSHIRHATTRVHGTEGWPYDPWPLAEWYWQCSQHAHWEHRHQVSFGVDTRKVSSAGRTGEEEYVIGGMPPTTLTLSALLRLYWRDNGCGSNGYP